MNKYVYKIKEYNFEGRPAAWWLAKLGKAAKEVGLCHCGKYGETGD
jgi:hypothetical protein